VMVRPGDTYSSPTWMSSKYWRLGSGIDISSRRSDPREPPALYHAECYNLID
jgi:hypothetical protein